MEYREIINDIRNQSYTVDSVHEAAQKILTAKNTSIPVRIIEICRNMGFSVFQQELPDNICGYIAIDGELKERFKTDRIISVNSKESTKRRRFTVAHELAHFLFDFDPNANIQFYNAFEIDHANVVPSNECLANRFAAELLMPADAFKKEYQRISQKQSSGAQLYEIVQELSDLFLVPPKAVELRIKKELSLHE